MSVELSNFKVLFLVDLTIKRKHVHDLGLDIYIKKDDKIVCEGKSTCIEGCFREDTLIISNIDFTGYYGSSYEEEFAKVLKKTKGFFVAVTQWYNYPSSYDIMSVVDGNVKTWGRDIKFDFFEKEKGWEKYMRAFLSMSQSPKAFSVFYDSFLDSVNFMIDDLGNGYFDNEENKGELGEPFQTLLEFPAYLESKKVTNK